jgi:SPP1 family phage portal protein
MTIDEILEIPQTAEAAYMQAQNVRVYDFLLGRHKVLTRPDFTYKGEMLRTAKILLQNVNSVVDFHTSYIVGSPVKLSGAENAVKVFQRIYNRSNYALVDYQIVDALVKYGNAYEYVFMRGNSVCSKVFKPLDSYPVFDDKGQYIAFLEHWTDSLTGNAYYNLYEPDRVTEYSTSANGTVQQVAEYRNLTGLPIHYTSGVPALYDCYGRGLVADLVPIVDELENLLSKTSDAVTTLSLNPLGVSSGQRIDARIDKDTIGATLNLEDGGRFEYASATIDHATVQFLAEQLLNQFYAVAEVPSVVFNGNVSNVSETSLKLLFNQLDNKARRTMLQLKEGFYARWDAMRRLLPPDALTDDEYNSLDAVFSLNRPTDNTALVADLERQYNAGALSKRSFIEQSPYTSDPDAEMQRIQEEAANSEAI